MILHGCLEESKKHCFPSKTEEYNPTKQKTLGKQNKIRAMLPESSRQSAEGPTCKLRGQLELAPPSRGQRRESLSPFSFLFHFFICSFSFFRFFSFAVFAFSAGASMTSAGASMRELLLMDSAIQQCNVDCRHCFGIGVGVGWVGN